LKSKERSSENEWRWVFLTLTAFVFTPGLRRVIDWKVHFSSIDFVSPLPLAMLLPIALFAYKNRSRLRGSPFLWVLGGWCIAFGYSALAGYVQLAGMTAAYGLAIYVLPIVVGAWIVTLEEPPRIVLERFSRCLLILGGIAGAYGIFQFIVAPPWDTEWMVNINAGSFGQPLPFQIRVFGPLNGPGVFATFLASTIIMTVTFLDVRKPWALGAVAAIFVSLVLSLIRTSWLEVILALAVLALFHPSRLRSISNIMLLTVISATAIAAFLALAPDDTIRYELGQRLATFQALSEDGSARDRANSADGALSASMANPQGIGLGASGTAAKLTPESTSAYFYNADPAIDNGYISRLYEMGFFGFSVFIITMGVAFIITVAAYRRALSIGNIEDVGLTAVCLAFFVGTLGSFYGGDSIQGITGVLFFVALALPSRIITDSRERDSKSLRDPMTAHGLTPVRS
jgi:hypothetical protein